MSLLVKLGVATSFSFLIACNAKSGSSTQSQSEARNGGDTIRLDGCASSPVRAKKGSVLELKLEAVPGSGYQWLLKDSSQVLQLLDGDNLKFTTPETQEPTPGLPGKQILLFKVVKEGSETIKLEYRRSWESDMMNSCEFRIEAG